MSDGRGKLKTGWYHCIGTTVAVEFVVHIKKLLADILLRMFHAYSTGVLINP
jgi:hypothetical protein